MEAILVEVRGFTYLGAIRIISDLTWMQFFMGELLIYVLCLVFFKLNKFEILFNFALAY